MEVLDLWSRLEAVVLTCRSLFCLALAGVSVPLACSPVSSGRWACTDLWVAVEQLLWLWVEVLDLWSVAQTLSGC